VHDEHVHAVFKSSGQIGRPQPVCGQKPRSQAFYDIEDTGEAEVTFSVPGDASQSETSDLPVEDRGMLANALGGITVTGKPRSSQATCEYEITEVTGN
jgi:hypothetical protein